MSLIRNFIKHCAHRVGLEVVNRKKYLKARIYNQNIEEERNALLQKFKSIEYIISNANIHESEDYSKLDFLQFLSDKLMLSRSQLFQDLFVLFTLKNKRNGYFVEFGATNGIELSNTWLLEKKYGWNGILCEPGKIWQSDLKQNRKCIIDNRCVWSQTGIELRFNETAISELSTVEQYNETDFHAESRKNGKTYKVSTVTLIDLLDCYHAPRKIDYLSIDTEGSEFEILKRFDFAKYKVGVITVEHNYSPIRKNIHALMLDNGFKNVFTSFSAFDDWYINEENISNAIGKD